MPPPVPEKIGRYDILNVIGRGGMGVLYRARDAALERDVALKMMLIDFSFDQTARERFEREAKAVARLQHHNVVTIHELGQSDGAPYIVMELLSGDDLEAVMRRSEPLTLAAKLEIVAQLCDGLGYAHEQGIVHRDIKPGNVRVLEDGTVKILDFGIAKFAQSSMTQSGAIMGTASYMAPEQILGNPVDGRADLFSVGVLLHELLAGQKPFNADSPTAVVYQIVHGEAPSIADAVPGLPDEVNQIVARALKKDPNERYARAGDMASDLRLVKMMLDLPMASSTTTAGGGATAVGMARLHATGVVTKPAGAPARAAGATATSAAGAAATTEAATPAARSRTPLLAAAALGVVAIGAAGYFFFGRPAATPPAATSTSAPAATTTPAPRPSPPAAPAAAAAAGVSGAVMVTSVPSGARIVMDGEDTGKVTPASIALASTAAGTIELSLKGHQTLSATLTAADVKRGKREFRLAREASPVKLTVTGAYPFEIRQGDTVLSPAASHHEVTVRPGAGTVVARSAEFLLNDTISVDFQKPEASATIRAAGILAVFAAVETCSILVDGQNLGFPPLPGKPIAAGTHTVVLRCRDGKEDSRKIVVTPGDRTAVTFGPPR